MKEYLQINDPELLATLEVMLSKGTLAKLFDRAYGYSQEFNVAPMDDVYEWLKEIDFQNQTSMAVAFAQKFMKR